LIASQLFRKSGVNFPPPSNARSFIHPPFASHHRPWRSIRSVVCFSTPQPVTLIALILVILNFDVFDVSLNGDRSSCCTDWTITNLNPNLRSPFGDSFCNRSHDTSICIRRLEYSVYPFFSLFLQISSGYNTAIAVNTNRPCLSCLNLRKISRRGPCRLRQEIFIHQRARCRYQVSLMAYEKGVRFNRPLLVAVSTTL
jgi:hypothetical protein